MISDRITPLAVIDREDGEPVALTIYDIPFNDDLVTIKLNREFLLRILLTHSTPSDQEAMS